MPKRVLREIFSRLGAGGGGGWFYGHPSHLDQHTWLIELQTDEDPKGRVKKGPRLRSVTYWQLFIYSKVCNRTYNTNLKSDIIMHYVLLYQTMKSICGHGGKVWHTHRVHITLYYLLREHTLVYGTIDWSHVTFLSCRGAVHTGASMSLHGHYAPRLWYYS